MNRTIKILALAVAMTVFAVPALAQSQECNDDNKGAWYKTFYDNFRGDANQQKTAVDAAKTYIAACPADPNDKQREYMQKFVDKWTAVQDKAKIAKDFDDAVKGKKYADQVRIGRLILAGDPDNPGINIVLGSAGLGDPNVLADSAQFAKKSIELIEAGKAFAPFTTKDQALAYLNYVIAKQTAKSDPNAAIPYFVKVARYESDLKKNPLLYNELAAAYGGGPVAKLAGDYQQYIGKPETTESKLVKANLNQAIDRQIDAFARAAALSTNAVDKKAIMDVLSDVYKGRNNQSDAGLNDLVATVLSKPIPDVPTPITTLPTEPASTPVTNGTSGSGNGAGNGTGNGAKPTANNMTTTNTGAKPGTTGQAGSAKPAASPTPMTKKPPVRYRRG